MYHLQAEIHPTGPLVPSLLHIGVQKIPRLVIKNRGNRDYMPTEIHLKLRELSVEPVRITVPQIPSGNKVELTDISLPLGLLNRAHLMTQQNRDNGIPCELTVTLDDNTPIGILETSVLPVNAWAYRHHPEALAAFVNKESTAVQQILASARKFLRRQLGVTAFADALELSSLSYGRRVEGMVQAIYECLAESFRIHYEREMRTYPYNWQKIRFHNRVLKERQGTCIDLALLLIACLENVHLEPVLILVKPDVDVQHALVGCWKEENGLQSAVIGKKNYNDIARRLPRPHGWNDLLLFDSTGFSVERNWPFSGACTEGLNCFLSTGVNDFVCAVNITLTRKASGRRPAISPLPFEEDCQLSNEGWLVVSRAGELAKEFHYDIVERAHLFLALLGSAENLARDLFGTETDSLKDKISKRLDRKIPSPKDVRFPQWTRSATRVWKLAGKMAENYAAGLTGPIQLFHALLIDPGETVQRVLSEEAIDSAALIQKLIDLANEDPQRDSYVESRSSDNDKED